jgi:hypothetical protein
LLHRIHDPVATAQAQNEVVTFADPRDRHGKTLRQNAHAHRSVTIFALH